MAKSAGILSSGKKIKKEWAAWFTNAKEKLNSTDKNDEGLLIDICKKATKGEMSET